MNKIKVIDLLNMISKGEEVPKRIRLFGDEFKIEDNEYYSVYTSELLISYFGEDYLRAELNDEVEILDEPKKIEKISWGEKENLAMYFTTSEEILARRTEKLKSSLNELIDEINNLKEKQ